MNKANTGNHPRTPTVLGPFRGLIIKFHKNITPNELKDLLINITVLNPGFQSIKMDKQKCTAYYRFPYNIAEIMERYKDSQDFTINIYQDRITKHLHPEVLYIKSKTIPNKLKHLGGRILIKNKYSLQVKFDNFKLTASAYEELHTENEVRFAFKSKTPWQERITVERHHGITSQLLSIIKTHLTEQKELYPKENMKSEDKNQKIDQIDNESDYSSIGSRINSSEETLHKSFKQISF